jgi:hypothetical protein
MGQMGGTKRLSASARSHQWLRWLGGSVHRRRTLAAAILAAAVAPSIVAHSGCPCRHRRAQTRHSRPGLLLVVMAWPLIGFTLFALGVVAGLLIMIMTLPRREPWETSRRMPRPVPLAPQGQAFEPWMVAELAELLVPDVVEAVVEVNRPRIGGIAFVGAARILASTDPAAAYEGWLAQLPALVGGYTCTHLGNAPPRSHPVERPGVRVPAGPSWGNESPRHIVSRQDW